MNMKIGKVLKVPMADAVEHQVENQVQNQVENQVGDQDEDQVEDKKVTIFNIINHSNMKPKNLECADCNNWLKRPIYKSPVIDNGNNYCFTCSNSNIESASTSTRTMSTKQRNDLLEDILEDNNYKYPCPFDYCGLIAPMNKMQEHTKNCPFELIKCPFCEEEFDEFDAGDHLRKQHIDSIHMITADIPLVNIRWVSSAQCVENEKIYVIDVRGNTFVIKIYMECGQVHLVIGKQTRPEQILNTSNDIIVCYKYRGREIVDRGKVQNLKNVIRDNEAKRITTLIDCDDGTIIDFDVYLCGFYKTKFNEIIGECPICFIAFHSFLYQCPSGHCICKECKKNITNCAECRQPIIDHQMGLKNVFPNIHFQCPFANVGCLAIITWDELDDHVARCWYAAVKCMQCEEMHPKIKIVEHMEERHDEDINSKPNLQKYSQMQTSTNECKDIQDFTQRVQYRHLLFSIERTNRVQEQQVGWKVNLLYSGNGAFNNAEQYRYEIQFFDEDNKCVHSVKNICQNESDTNVSSLTAWKNIQPLRFKSGDEYVNSVMYCIYEE